MDSNLFSSSIGLLFLLLIWRSSCARCQDISFSVDEAGAVADGVTDSKQAFLNAWKQACATKGGKMVIGGNKSYFVSDIVFMGPCYGQTNFQLDGTIIGPPFPTHNLEDWILFRNVDKLHIYGNGTFNGNGASFWRSGKQDFVVSVKLQSVRYSSVAGINSVNSKKVHIGINGCESVSFNNIHLTAPGDSPNTDGIHVGASNNIWVTDANIATGDDCISIGDGTTNMNITRVTCGPGHGISIGSLGRYPAEKPVQWVRVTNSTFIRTQNGLRIKTFAPSPPGWVSDVTYEHITMEDVSNAIIIDQHYCPHQTCLSMYDSRVHIEKVKFVDVRGSSSEAVGVKIACSKSCPCKDIELTGVNINYKGGPTTATCSSADVKFLGYKQIPSRCS